MAATAKVFNDKPDVVIDGGGLVTLDGQGARRILYMNTCDQGLVWTTSHCQDQDHPTLTVQHIAFANGRSIGHRPRTAAARSSSAAGGSGSSTASFYGNRCASTGPDVGGAVASRSSRSTTACPSTSCNSTFGGSGDRRNECSNGGGISSIGVSWTILNSLFTGQPGDRQRRQPAQERARPAAATAARSTTTATR